MWKEELRQEIEKGVDFWASEKAGKLIGTMGRQQVQDVSLIRHAYVQPGQQNKGIGGKLLSFIKDEAERPLLVGTWAAAT